MIPVRIQNGVDKEYEITQDAKWDVKQDEVENKVKIILATEFPAFFKKKYLDSFEEGSELYIENTNLLKAVQKGKGKVREIRKRGLETGVVW